MMTKRIEELRRTLDAAETITDCAGSADRSRQTAMSRTAIKNVRTVSAKWDSRNDPAGMRVSGLRDDAVTAGIFLKHSLSGKSWYFHVALPPA